MALPRWIGVVHLAAMPGDPAYAGGGFAAAMDAARRDARALAEGGMQAIIVENFGSWPFPKGHPEQPTPPWQVAALTRAALVVQAESGLPIGVNVLRNDAYAAMGIAAASGSAFIRVNVHAGAALTDQGVIEGRAFETLRVRRMLGADDVAILADVRVKHAVPLAERPLCEEVEELVLRAGADGVIVTGVGTGHPVDEAILGEVAAVAGETPVYIGSGMSPERRHLLDHAHGAIVGTWVKEEGDVRRPVSVERVRRLVGG